MNEKDEKTEQIVISGCPKSLVQKLDALAAQEHRSRAKQIVVLLEEILSMKLAAAEALR